MALRVFWGFDHEATSQEVSDIVPGSTVVGVFSSITPYNDGRSFSFTLSAHKLDLLFDAQQTWITGFHHHPNDPGAMDLVEYKDETTTQIKLRVNSAGQLQVVHGGGAILATTPDYYDDPTWKHVEFKAMIDNAAGAFEVRVNERIVLSASGVDTQNTANASANRVYFGVGDRLLDNLWICDGAGATFNNFIGELRVITRRPNAAGFYTQWTPNTGLNWAAVDDPQTDNDSTYVSSITPGNKDSFPLVALGVDSGAILAVAQNIRARKDDVDQREIAMLARQDSTDYEGANLELLATYKNWKDIRTTCPDATEWTREKFETMQFGYNQKV